MSEELTCCPGCDSSNIDRNGIGSHLSQKDIPAYHCEDCGHRFDEPATRPPQAKTSLSGIAGVLDKADPDESLLEVARRAVNGRAQ